jgi:hypothetical protein
MARIALFIHGLSGGGVQRSTINLAKELARAHATPSTRVSCLQPAGIHGDCVWTCR